MARLPGNQQLLSRDGTPLRSLREINRCPVEEKERIYRGLIPPALYTRFSIDPETGMTPGMFRGVTIIAPENLGLLRIEVYRSGDDPDPLFFLDLADTQFHQMELAFCIITDPDAPRYHVDRTEDGRRNYFASMGRNIPEEIRAMEAGLFPNQTRRGMRLFGEFFPRFERFVDSLGIDMIVAEPLTYDNAIRYEGYGFDYLTGRRLMERIQHGFSPGGDLTRRLDSSTPFRKPAFSRTVRGRSWAIHDGILDEPWDGVSIYKMIGVHAGVDTFPDRIPEKETSDGNG
ncbi:MAG: hypothetical protein Fur0034_10680 [Desulfuromonadia bacterium]